MGCQKLFTIRFITLLALALLLCSCLFGSEEEEPYYMTFWGLDTMDPGITFAVGYETTGTAHFAPSLPEGLRVVSSNTDVFTVESIPGSTDDRNLDFRFHVVGPGTAQISAQTTDKVYLQETLRAAEIGEFRLFDNRKYSEYQRSLARINGREDELGFDEEVEYLSLLPDADWRFELLPFDTAGNQLKAEPITVDVASDDPSVVSPSAATIQTTVPFVISGKESGTSRLTFNDPMSSVNRSYLVEIVDHSQINDAEIIGLSWSRGRGAESAGQGVGYEEGFVFLQPLRLEGNRVFGGTCAFTILEGESILREFLPHPEEGCAQSFTAISDGTFTVQGTHLESGWDASVSVTLSKSYYRD